MERLWSYMRQFGKMTKEMRPSYRTDVPVHALVHYGRKSKAKLGNYNIVYVNMTVIIGRLLVSRWKKAEITYKTSTETFTKLVETHNGWFVIHIKLGITF